MMAAQYTEVTSGPLPDARQFEHYEKVLPGSAERLLRMAEIQSAHRQALERQAVASNIRDSRQGVVFAFVICMATVLGGTVVALLGEAWPGVVLGSSGLAGIASVFVYGTRSSRKEREAKEREIGD
jgi:uncharacterized membrane protein